jgi:hypothetical protein
MASGNFASVKKKVICIWAVFTESVETNKKKRARRKQKAASPNKPEDLSPLELFMASGFDLSQIANLSVSTLLIWINTHRSDILTSLLSSQCYEACPKSI